jgi:hypothetical protein
LKKGDLKLHGAMLLCLRRSFVIEVREKVDGIIEDADFLYLYLVGEA